MILNCDEFENNMLIPSKYTCEGENINPRLFISKLPENTKSLALIFKNSDTGELHWLLWNINKNTTEIKENSVPAGSKEGISDFGTKEYCGPCPLCGLNNYTFRIFALNKKLNLNPETKKEIVLKSIEHHSIGNAELNGKYAKFKSFIIPCKCR